MSSQLIRARIAPVALVAGVGFVIVGFLHTQRQLVRIEHEQASMLLSESSARVELFLADRIVGLTFLEAIVDSHRTEHSAIDDSLAPPRALRSPGRMTLFDDVWIVDSVGRVQGNAVVEGERRPVLDTTGRVPELADIFAVPRLAVVQRQGRLWLLFAKPLNRTPDRSIVGVVAIDSLAAVMLPRRHPRIDARLMLMISGDTALRINAGLGNARGRSIEQRVRTAADSSWRIAVAYAPVGHGAEIALWTVGLTTISALGLALLLERRETSRIADRSSELEHLSAELLRANRAKSEFLANVSHELRTPLNAIVGFVDLLRDGVYGPLNSRQTGPVERIEASANHLRHLVDQVLDLAKMAAGRLEVHTEPLELRPFVFDVASEVEPLMTEKGLSFSLAVGASLPRVRTDPTHLRQILINLLGNAVKFTTNGGISVRGRLVEHRAPALMTIVPSGGLPQLAPPGPGDFPWIALQVADSGIGIPEKDRDRIFDEFEQVNAGPRGDSMRRGTGLGLSISRRLARLLGGDITVESELGRGSVFTVWLPVDPSDLRGDSVA